jgi:hypothetical protein
MSKTRQGKRADRMDRLDTPTVHSDPSGEQERQSEQGGGRLGSNGTHLTSSSEPGRTRSKIDQCGKRDQDA